MPNSRYILAGGGTGGHLYPGIAVAHALRAADPGARVTFMTTDRPLDRDLLSRTPFDQIPQPVRPLSAKPWHWPRFYRAWRQSLALARNAFAEQRPDSVLGLGGYAAGPPVVAAHKAGIRTAILNPDAIPGKANRFLAKQVDRVFLQWEITKKHLADDVKCEVAGCPIRADFGPANPDRVRREHKIGSGRPLLLVTGASQGARSVNDTLVEVWPHFSHQHPEWQLVHLTGAADEARIRAAYSGQSSPPVVLAFSHEMADWLAAADLIVSRAGASTLAEITALAKPAILFPYPYHRDQHQRANAQVLVDAGAAVLIDDGKDSRINAPRLRDALERLVDPHTRRQMSAGAATLARPDAAARIALWLAGR